MSLVLIKGSFGSFFLFLSSRYFKIESISSPPYPTADLFDSITSICLNRFDSIASCFLVCLNFYFVALKTSIFLSSFCVSSLAPAGFYSKISSLFALSDTIMFTPLKKSCFKILYDPRNTLLQSASFERNSEAWTQ